MEATRDILETAFEGRDIRVLVDEEGRVWVCAADLFAANDITWSGKKSLTNLPNEWVRLVSCTGPTGLNDTYFLAEPAVYTTLSRSRKPGAKRFSRWVFGEVIPSIRANGYYGELDSIARKRLTDVFIKLVDKIVAGDAFTQQALLPQLRNLSLILRVPLPDLELVGKDPRQYRLELLGKG